MKMKTRILLIVMLAMVGLSGNLKSQTPTWLWARTATNIGNAWMYTEGLSVTTDLLGNVYATGYFSDTLIFGADTLTHPGIYIVKYDSSGNVIFAKDGSGFANGLGVAVDAAGNIYVAGAFNSDSISFGPYTLLNSGPFYIYDIFLVKYNSSGVIQWLRGAKGTSNDKALGIATDDFGNVIITGFSQSPTLIFGSDTLIKTGLSFIFLVKYDSSGNILFAKTATASTNNLAATSISVCTDISGNSYISGYISTGNSNTAFISFDNITLMDSASSFSYIVKYSPAGSALWARKATGTGNWTSCGLGITANSLGKIYTTGYYTGTSVSFGSNTIFNNGIQNVFLTKYDTFGNVIYARNIGGTGSNDKGYSVASDDNDNIFVTGEFGSPSMNFDTIVVQNPGGTDPMFFTKYNSTGHALYATAFPSGADDNNDVAVDHFGNAFICGDFYQVNPFIIGSDSLPLTCEEAFFIAKFGLSNIETNSKEITATPSFLLYPNPFTTTTTLTLQGTYHNPSLFIYNLLGQEVRSIPVGTSKEVTIPRGNLPAGMYFYKLIEENKEVLGIGKLLVE